jgi:hypothetical protein
MEINKKLANGVVIRKEGKNMVIEIAFAERKKEADTNIIKEFWIVKQHKHPKDRQSKQDNPMQ